MTMGAAPVETRPACACRVHVARISDLPEDWRDGMPPIAARYRLLALGEGPEDACRAEFCAGLLLARFLGVVADGQLAFGPSGKPALAKGSTSFSISHGGDLVVLAVAQQDVGVDVERVPGAYGACERAAARRVFPEAVLAELDSLPPDEAARLFARVWTRMEAALKARGSGFDLDPRAHPEALAGWEVESVEHEGHVVSVARRDPTCIELAPVDLAALMRQDGEGAETEGAG